MAHRTRFTRLRPGNRAGKPSARQAAASSLSNGNNYNRNTNANTNSNPYSGYSNEDYNASSSNAANSYNSYSSNDANYDYNNSNNNNDANNNSYNNYNNNNNNATSYGGDGLDNDGFLDTSQYYNNNAQSGQSTQSDANAYDGNFDSIFDANGSNNAQMSQTQNAVSGARNKLSRPRPPRHKARPVPNTANNASVQGSGPSMGSMRNMGNVGNVGNNGANANAQGFGDMAANMANMASLGASLTQMAAGNNLGAAGAIGRGVMQNVLDTNPNIAGFFEQTRQGQPFWTLGYYKYYFRVDNKYVIYKLKSLMLPFLRRNISDWSRKATSGVNSEGTGPGSGYEAAVNDVNAPDGYLPLMAVITYIVIMGFVAGVSDANSSEQLFTPQILISTASSAFGGLIFEVVLMKLGFYLIGTIAQPPILLDLICYAGYKLIFVTLNLLVYLVIDSLIAYYVVAFSTGALAAFFMIQTLRPYFLVRSNSNSSGINFSNLSGSMSAMMQGNEPLQLKRFFLLGVGIWQIIFILIMGRNMA